MSWTHSLTRWLYRLTIPWIWLAVALVSWRHPGDEYGLFVIANGLPSALVVVWFGVTGTPDHVFTTMILCSFAAMCLISWVMDRVRVPWWLVISFWLMAAITLFRMAYGSFESHARAIAKNGSLTAYVTASSNLALFLACIAAIVLAGIYWLAARYWVKPHFNSTGMLPSR